MLPGVCGQLRNKWDPAHLFLCDRHCIGPHTRRNPYHPAPVEPLDAQAIIEQHYANLYRFALSLSRDESTAWDLTQQTYYLWAKKGHQLRDASKVKTWLFTTLYHEFLATRRQQSRFVSDTMSEHEQPLPPTHEAASEPLDCAAIHQALSKLREESRAVLTLFYLKSNSYKEIAEILGIPIGTVMSRISRGKAELRKLLSDPASPGDTSAPPEGQP